MHKTQSQNTISNLKVCGITLAAAFASPVAAQDVFVKCSDYIISFNQENQSIYRYDIDGNRISSLCALKQEQALGDRRSRVLHSYSGLQCAVSDAEVTVKYNWNRESQFFDPIRGWETASRLAPKFITGLKIDRRSGSFMYDRPSGVSDKVFGICERIDRPTPRANKF